MLTENSEQTVVTGAPPTVFYDDACGLCLATVARLKPVLLKRGFVFRPLPAGDPKTEMKLRLPDGSWRGGADALMEMARAVRWARPLVWLTCFPGMMPLVRRIYRRIARNRHCADGVCGWRPPGLKTPSH
ncbi:MAG: DUF393 domain-containing protein [Verrucomicrobiota bacterium]